MSFQATSSSVQSSRLEDLTAWADDAARGSKLPVEGVPFLKNFDESTLREAIIHLYTARRQLIQQCKTLYRTKERYYSDPRYASLFADLDDGFSWDVNIDRTFCLEVFDDVEDIAGAVRNWKSLFPKDTMRRLRFTVSAIAYLNARMRTALTHLSNAIAVARGDVEPAENASGENKENIA